MHTAFFGLPNNSQVIRVRGAAAPILFSFRLPVCYARPIYIYIYIIRVPTRDRNNEFILHETKMADLEGRQFEIGLKFVCRSFAELNNFSEGSSKPKKDAQVIRVRGRQPHEFFNSNYLFQLE